MKLHPATTLPMYVVSLVEDVDRPGIQAVGCRPIVGFGQSRIDDSRITAYIFNDETFSIEPLDEEPHILGVLERFHGETTAAFVGRAYALAKSTGFDGLPYSLNALFLAPADE